MHYFHNKSSKFIFDRPYLQQFCTWWYTSFYACILTFMSRELCLRMLIWGLPLITYAPRGGGGVNANAYKCVQGGRGGLNMTKNTHLYAGLLKMPQYLKHLTHLLPQALILPKLGYPLISIYSNRESPGNPREFPKMIMKCFIMQEAIPEIIIMQ